MPNEPQLHRVKLCRSEFLVIEVLASDRAEALHIAEGMKRQARREFVTTTNAYRAERLRRANPHDPQSALVWREI